jgi:hypothetical protein
MIRKFAAQTRGVVEGRSKFYRFGFTASTLKLQNSPVLVVAISIPDEGIEHEIPDEHIYRVTDTLGIGGQRRLEFRRANLQYCTDDLDNVLHSITSVITASLDRIIVSDPGHISLPWVRRTLSGSLTKLRESTPCRPSSATANSTEAWGKPISRASSVAIFSDQSSPGGGPPFGMRFHLINQRTDSSDGSRIHSLSLVPTGSGWSETQADTLMIGNILPAQGGSLGGSKWPTGRRG